MTLLGAVCYRFVFFIDCWANRDDLVVVLSWEFFFPQVPTNSGQNYPNPNPIPNHWDHISSLLGQIWLLACEANIKSIRILPPTSLKRILEGSDILHRECQETEEDLLKGLVLHLTLWHPTRVALISLLFPPLHFSSPVIIKYPAWIALLLQNHENLSSHNVETAQEDEMKSKTILRVKWYMHYRHRGMKWWKTVNSSMSCEEILFIYTQTHLCMF